MYVSVAYVYIGMYPKRYIIKATNAKIKNKNEKLSLEKTNKFSLIPCWSFMSDSVNDLDRGLRCRRRRTITYAIKKTYKKKQQYLYILKKFFQK